MDLLKIGDIVFGFRLTMEQIRTLITCRCQFRMSCKLIRSTPCILFRYYWKIIKCWMRFSEHTVHCRRETIIKSLIVLQTHSQSLYFFLPLFHHLAHSSSICFCEQTYQTTFENISIHPHRFYSLGSPFERPFEMGTGNTHTAHTPNIFN